jgi:hypothetical protein
VIGVTNVPSSVTNDGAALTQVATPDALTTAASGWIHTSDVGGTVLVKVPAGSHTVVITFP